MALGTQLIGHDGAGTITSGQRAESTITAGRQVPQYLDELVYINADCAPLFALMKARKQSKVVRNITYFHLETDMLPQVMECAGTDTSADTTVAVTSGHATRAMVDSVLLNVRTGEMMRVTAISGNNLTVTRGVAGTSAAATAANDELHIQGMAADDGDDATNGPTSEPSLVTNTCQIFRQPLELTGRTEEAAVYGPDEKTRTMKDSHEAIMHQIEKAYLFNPGIATTDPTITAGLPYWVTTNVTDQSGAALDEATWNSFLSDCFRRNQGGGKSNILFLAGENILQAIDTFKRDSILYKPDDKFLGMPVAGYGNYSGTVNLMRHCLLSDTLGSGASYGRHGGYGFFVNLNRIGRAVYGSRDLHLRSNIETPGSDSKKWEWFSDEGLYVMNEKCHGIIKGVLAS